MDIELRDAKLKLGLIEDFKKRVTVADEEAAAAVAEVAEVKV